MLSIYNNVHSNHELKTGQSCLALDFVNLRVLSSNFPAKNLGKGVQCQLFCCCRNFISLLLHHRTRSFSKLSCSHSWRCPVHTHNAALHHCGGHNISCLIYICCLYTVIIQYWCMLQGAPSTPAFMEAILQQSMKESPLGLDPAALKIVMVIILLPTGASIFAPAVKEIWSSCSKASGAMFWVSLWDFSC